MENLQWRKNAKCKDLDPEIFFPNEKVMEDQAKAICSSCPVRVACLRYAIEHRIKNGIWGGTTEDEREKLVRRKKIA